MAYEHKEGQGSLFKNDKQNDAAPQQGEYRQQYRPAQPQPEPAPAPTQEFSPADDDLPF